MDADAIGKLAERYEALTPQERRRYNEANTRKDFIEPLFEALGWNVRDKQEVDAERLVRPGFADYAFLVEGVPRFFVEAKPLTDDLYNPGYARQVITYAYNKGVAWALLCNFTGLQVFNAEWETGDLNSARVLNLACGDYAGADSPLRLLSREAFVNNELEKHAQAFGGMRPRLPVEKSLYGQMRDWRERLFNGIARIRPDLTLEQVDEVIERLLNRLIFIRNCEDRRVGEASLRAALHQWRQPGRRVGLTEAVRGVFADFDKTFDSDLFALHEVDRVLGSGTHLEDTLGDIVGGLYEPPRSLAAYDFSVIDADVLGQVYEQYLGHVAQVAKERAAKTERQLRLGVEVAPIELEAKRQRRKEHGIYYTPKWVVDYIVRQTVGRYLEEHSHNDILNVRILDPACGSGSFLIRAFDVLLEYHGRVKGKAVLDLDQYERLPILTANVYGVDLDQRAVDIARLNLLLRAVAQRELLPSLAQNVVRGNSLISGTEAELRPYFGDGWREKQPFDWEREFPAVMEQGGFDIVIGNPPYVRIQTLDREDVAYYNEQYAAATGNYDIYTLFVEKGLELLRPGGALGFIVPNKFMQAAYGRGLRRLLSEAKAVSKIVDFGDAQVFESGTNYTCLLFLRKEPVGEAFYVPAAAAVKERPEAPRLADAEKVGFHVGCANLREGSWTFAAAGRSGLLEKLAGAGPRLGEMAQGIFQGVITGADKVFILHKRGVSGDGLVRVRSDATRLEHEVEEQILRPMVKGSRHVHRYHIDRPGLVLLFPYDTSGGPARLFTAEEMADRFPKAWAYLEMNRESLESRESGKLAGPQWYRYGRVQNMAEFQKPKLLVPYMVDRVRAFFDRGEGLYLVNVTTGGYGVSLKEPRLYPLVCSILNSKVAHFFMRLKATPHQGGYYGCTSGVLGQIPIRLPNMSEPVGKKQHDDLVALVQRMLDLHERLAQSGGVVDEERGQIEREIERTDREIDELVYELYGLTEEERRIVEEEVRR